MAHLNRPLTSREFKIMLDTNRFKDRKKGIKEISSIVESIIEEQGGKFDAHNKDNEEERKASSSLDTNACELYCDKKFLLRIRKEKESGIYDVALKCRHPDRYVSALYGSLEPRRRQTEFGINFKIKFEEDILTDKMTDKMTDGRITSISKFSLSASLEGKQIPDFKTIKDLVSIFPNLD